MDFSSFSRSTLDTCGNDCQLSVVVVVVVWLWMIVFVGWSVLISQSELPPQLKDGGFRLILIKILRKIIVVCISHILYYSFCRVLVKI